MKSNSITATTAFLAADGAVGYGDGVIGVGLLARLLQPVGVALGVAKPQRIGDGLREFDAGVGVLVERPVQPFGRGGAHVVAAMGTHLAVGREVAVEDHLLAGRALVPQVVRHGRPGEQGADLRSDVFGEPAHAGVDSVAGCLGQVRVTVASHARSDRAIAVMHVRKCNVFVAIRIAAGGTGLDIPFNVGTPGKREGMFIPADQAEPESEDQVLPMLHVVHPPIGYAHYKNEVYQ